MPSPFLLPRPIVIAVLACVVPAAGSAAQPAKALKAEAPAGKAVLAEPRPWLTATRVRWTAGNKRKTLCDFAAYSQARQDLPMQDDLLWRAPPPEVKAKLGEARKALMGVTAKDTPAERDLTALLAGPWGLTLARMALQDKDLAVVAVALRAAVPMSSQEPRLAGFAVAHTTAKDPELAKAAITLMGRSGCDTPALFALDALGHADPSVGMTAVAVALAAARDSSDVGLAQRLLSWLIKGQGATMVRVAALRAVGDLGWLSAGNDLEALTKDADPAVAGEALAAFGACAPFRAVSAIEAGLKSKQALVRVGAVRGAAKALAMQPAQADKLLRPLLNDQSAVRDAARPVDQPTKVADHAAVALKQLGRPVAL